MKLIQKSDREEYLSEQVTRSQEKFSYCKVAYKHVVSWREILSKCGANKLNNIVCLGTRNGREIDLFRLVFHSPFFSHIARRLEIRRAGYNSVWPKVESYGRNDISSWREKNVFGCEINPDGKRDDVYIGSFDDLPEEWTDKFDLIYSNSIDQSIDPERTATHWKRILKPGGYVILGFSDAAPTESDPLGDISVQDLISLFQGELLFFAKNHSNYHDAILRL